MGKNMSRKCRQKLLGTTNISAMEECKINSKKNHCKKTAEATRDLVGNNLQRRLQRLHHQNPQHLLKQIRQI